MTKHSRRAFLAGLMNSAATVALAQGTASHKQATQPRGKRSGIPFLSKFTEVGSQAGLIHPSIYGPVDHKDYILETIGCGCAFLDFDKDGWMDVLVLSGTRLGGPAEPALAEIPSNRLYKNNRDGTFSDVTAASGLLRSGWFCGVCIGDYNNDGFEDIFISGWGGNILYRNNGNGTFTDVTKEAGLVQDGHRWGTGCTFIDYNRDGNLDLFVSNYLDFNPATAPRPGQAPNCLYEGTAVNCGPKGFPFGHHNLYRNNGNGTFSDVSVVSGIAKATSSYALTAIAADFDDDGWPDLYVACDSTPGLLFMNNHDGTFREEGTIRGVAYSDDGDEQAGMGIAVSDYNLDGRLDIIKTNFANDVPTLYKNIGAGLFEEATRAAGLAVDNRFVCWGTGMEDFDNDGLPDIFAVSGHVYPEIERRLPNYPFKGPRLLFRNLGGGKFEELLDLPGDGLMVPHSSRGCAFGDFDNDGDIDILIVNLNEAPSLLRNDVTSGNHWIKVALFGVTSNRSAIGARVVVKTAASVQTQEVQSQSSFLSCNDPRLHFGLGKLKEASVRVRWPTGLWQSIEQVQIDRLTTIKEGVGVVKNIGW